jgi:farnesyl-diphosphate farnesyltransferase
VLLEAAGAVGRALEEIERRRQFARRAVAQPALVALVDGLAEVLLEPIAPVLRSRAALATDADRAVCADLLPRVSRTFALSISLLPPSLRDAVGVSYLLCRVLDTVEDDFSAPQRVREAMFDAAERLLGEVGGSTAEFAATGAWLGATADETALMAASGSVFRVWWTLPADQRGAIAPWLMEMSRGMRETTRRRAADRGVLRLADMADLERYCGYVAGTVGGLLTGLFRQTCPAATIPAPVEGDAGWTFGLGLQLVNILKDVAEDAERGVCWLPADKLADEGLEVCDLLDPERRDAAMRVVRAVAEVAREHLRVAIRYALAWPAAEGRDVRLFCAVPLAFAWLTLDAVEAGDDTLVAGRTPKISRDVVGRVLAEAAERAGSDALDAWLWSFDAACRPQRGAA